MEALGKYLRPQGAEDVDDSPKIVFSHVPKCGGTSLSRAIVEQYVIPQGLQFYQIDLAGSQEISSLSR